MDPCTTEPAVTDTLAQAGINLMNTLQSWLASGGDFAADQIPLVVMETLNWGFWSEVVDASSSLFIIIVICWAMNKTIRWGTMCLPPQDSRNWSAYNHYWATCIVGNFCNFILFSDMTYSIMQAIQIVVAPRLYLLEHAASLIK